VIAQPLRTHPGDAGSPPSLSSARRYRLAMMMRRQFEGDHTNEKAAKYQFGRHRALRLIRSRATAETNSGRLTIFACLVLIILNRSDVGNGWIGPSI